MPKLTYPASQQCLLAEVHALISLLDWGLPVSGKLRAQAEFSCLSGLPCVQTLLYHDILLPFGKKQIVKNYQFSSPSCTPKEIFVSLPR